MHIYDLIGVLDGNHTTPSHPEIRLLPEAGMTAVLSPRSPCDATLPTDQTSCLSEAARRLALQESCLPLSTLLPVQRTYGLTQLQARRFLLANQPFLANLLRRHAGLVQVQVTVRWREEVALDHFRNHPAIRPLFALARLNSKNVIDAVTELSADLCRQIEGYLLPRATERIALPVTRSILWNGVLLLPLGRLSDLDDAIEQIDAIWSDGFAISQIGPAPIASFALVTLETVTPAQVAQANAIFRTAPSIQWGLRAGLKAAGQNAEKRDSIRLLARIAEAAARLPTPEEGLSLAGLRTEGHSIAINTQQAVA